MAKKEYYLSLDGKRIDLTEDQLKTLGINVEDTMESKFNRVDMYDGYYYITAEGNVVNTREGRQGADNYLYDTANYCTDKDLLQQRAYRETLNRLLWRFSMMNEGDKIDYEDRSARYYIYLDAETNKFRVKYSNIYIVEGIIYFYTEAIAKRAIEEIIKPFMEAHSDMEYYNVR